MKNKALGRFSGMTFVLLLVLGVTQITEANPRKPKVRKLTTAELVFERAPDLRSTPTRDTLALENEVADAHHLPRIKNREELLDKIDSEYLTCVPEKSRYFYLDPRSQKDLRYLVPDALRYLRPLAGDYDEQFNSSKHSQFMKITSLVRTEEYQKKLTRKNANAAKSEVPEHRSVHTTGYAFDIGTKGLTREQILWLADYLENDIRAGKILAIYEHKSQQDFHVFVIPQDTP